jgi:hypothetical protein
MSKNHKIPKLLNLGFGDIGLNADAVSRSQIRTEELELLTKLATEVKDKDSIPPDVLEAVSEYLNSNDSELIANLISALGLTEKVKEVADKSLPKSGGKKSVLTKWTQRSSKLFAASSASPEAKAFILDKKRFIALDTPESVALMLNGKLSPLSGVNVATAAFDVAIENSEWKDAIPFEWVPNVDNFVDDESEKPGYHREYHSHYGFFPNHKPIVTADAKRYAAALLSRPKCKEHSVWVQALATPFEHHTSRISRFCTAADKDVYRDLLEGTEFAGENYREHFRAVQNVVSEKLGNTYGKLREIETQTRKTGPRVRKSDPAFWDQIQKLYTERDLTEDGKQMLKIGTESFFQRFKNKVGTLSPIPLLIGVESSRDIKNIVKLIYSDNEQVAVLGKQIWENILSTSLGNECVYTHLKKSTSKGAPYFSSKITSLEWCHIILGWYLQMENPEKGLNTTPFQLVERVQNSTPDMEDDTQINKVRHRVAQGLPVDKAWHMAFTVPLASAMSEMDEFASMLGHEEVGLALEKELQPYFDSGKLFTMCSTDISGYDSGLTAVMKEDCVWEALADLFGGGIVTNVMKNWKQFYLYAPLCVPGGYLTGIHGLQSGASGTASLGTIWNMVINEGIAKAKNLKMITSKFQGDDAFVAFEGNDLSLEEICSLLGEFGHEAAVDPVKQAFMLSTDPEPYCYFVGKYFFFKGENPYKPVYCVSDMVARFVYPEDQNKGLEAELKLKEWTDYSFVNTYVTYSSNFKAKKGVGNPSLDIAVKLTQSLGNCEHHPLFDELVEDLVSKKPGLFYPLVHEDLGNSAYFYDLVAQSGTLVGIDKDDFIQGFTAQTGVQKVLQVLKKTGFTYESYENYCDLSSLAEPIGKYKSIRADINRGSEDVDELHSALDSLSKKLSGRAVNDLRQMIKEIRPTRKKAVKPKAVEFASTLDEFRHRTKNTHQA